MTAFITAAILFLYRGTLDNPIFGDSIYTLKEEVLRSRIRALSFFTPRWLTFASFNWIYEFCGKDWYWQNLANIALHAAATASLYFLYRALFEAVADRDVSFSTPDSRAHAFVAALFFGFNPLSAYATAYLIQRSILLAVLFSILSLRTFLAGLTRKSVPAYLLSVFFYFTAMQCKEHVVMLPAVMFLLAVLVRRPDKEAWVPLFKELAPAFVLAAMIALRTMWSLKGQEAFQTYEPNAQAILKEAATAGFQPTGRLGVLSAISQAWLFFRYVFLSFVPWTGTMSIDVLLPFPNSYWTWPDAFGAIAYLALPIPAWRLIRVGGKIGLCGFALFAPWVLFWTEFVIPRVSEQFVLYRAYAWTPWLFACLPAASAALAKIPRIGRNGALAVLAGAGLVFAMATARVLPTLDSASSAWADAAAKIEDLPRVAYKAYRAYYFLGQSLFYENKMDGALAAYGKAVELRPGIPEAYQNIGYIHVRRGDYEKARLAYETQLSYHPGSAEALLNLGNVASSTGDDEKAEEYLNLSLAADPTAPKTRYNLGLLHAKTGRDDEALNDYDATVRLAGTGELAANAHCEAGLLFLKKGDAESAFKRFRQALDLVPDHPKTKKILDIMRRTPQI
jgi:tetratricopeptide (TPR) repeat protein